MYDDIFEGLMSQAEDAIPKFDEDYIKDGLLYCGKCDTPKQCRITFCGRVVTPYCLCSCEKKRIAQEDFEARERERKKRIAERRRMAFPNSELAECTFERSNGADEKGMTAAQNYVKHFAQFYKDGQGLLFFGGVGVGKTYLAACIANALIDQGYSCLMTTFTRIVNEIQSTYDGRQEYIDELCDYDLLVIDDFAAERNTEYMNEQVFTILDQRLRVGKPLILTTNLTSEELKNPSDLMRQRMYSRIYELCIPVEVCGKDRRRTGLSRSYADAKKLLGV